MNTPPPTPEDLEAELERVRAQQPELPSPAQPSIGQHLKQRVLRLLLLWVVLIVLFLAIHHWLD